MKRQRVLAGLLAGMLVFSNCAPTWAAEDVLTDYTEEPTVSTEQEEEPADTYTEEASDNTDAANVQQQDGYTAEEVGTDFEEADPEAAFSTEIDNNDEDEDLDADTTGEVFVDDTANGEDGDVDIPDAEFGMIEADDEVDNDADEGGLLMASGVEPEEEDEEITAGDDEEEALLQAADGDEYCEILPRSIDISKIGASVEVTPSLVRHYVNAQDDEETEVLTDVHFRWSSFDPNVITITDANNENVDPDDPSVEYKAPFTITHSGLGSTDAYLVAQIPGGQEYSTNYYISGREDYDINIEDGLNEIFSDDEDASMVVNTEQLDEDELGYSLVLEAGIWDDENNQMSVMCPAEAILLDQVQHTIHLNGSKLWEFCQTNTCSGITLCVSAMVGDTCVANLIWSVTVIEPELEFDGEQDCDMLIGNADPIWVDSPFHVWIRNKENPEGTYYSYRVTDVSIEEAHPSEEGGSVVQITQKTDEYGDQYWEYKAIGSGEAVLKVTAIIDDDSEKEASYTFQVSVREELYEFRYERASESVLPGERLIITPHLMHIYLDEDGIEMEQEIEDYTLTLINNNNPNAVSAEVDDSSGKPVIEMTGQLPTDWAENNAEVTVKISFTVAGSQPQEMERTFNCWVESSRVTLECDPEKEEQIRHIGIGEKLDPSQLGLKLIKRSVDDDGALVTEDVTDQTDVYRIKLFITENSHVWSKDDEEALLPVLTRVSSDDSTIEFFVEQSSEQDEDDWSYCTYKDIEIEELNFNFDFNLDRRDEYGNSWIFSDEETLTLPFISDIPENIDGKYEWHVGCYYEDSDDEYPDSDVFGGNDSRYYTVAQDGKAITLYGPALGELFSGDDDDDGYSGIDITVCYVYGEEVLCRRNIYIKVRESWTDYRSLEDKEMLPGWEEEIEPKISYHMENSVYPDGYDGEVPVTEMQILSQELWEDGENVITLDGNAEDGWHIEALNYGEAEVEYTYQTLDGSSATATFMVYVKGEVFRTEYEYQENDDRMLVNSSKEIGIKVFRMAEDEEDSEITGYRIKDLEFDDWRINVTLGDDGQGHKVLKVRSGDETGDANISFTAYWKNEEGYEQSIRGYAHVYIDNGYYYITPEQLETEEGGSTVRLNPAVGEILDLNGINPALFLREINYDDDSVVNTPIESGFGFALDYDEDRWEVVQPDPDGPEGPQLATLRRISREGTGVDLVAYVTKDINPDDPEDTGERARRWYSFDWINYDVSIDRTGIYLNEYDDTCIFNNQDLDLTANTDNLNNLDEDSYDIEWAIGFWNEENEELEELDNATLAGALTVNPDDPSKITLHGSALYPLRDEEEERYGVNVEVRVKANGQIQSSDSIYVDLREAEYWADVPREEADAPVDDNCDLYLLRGYGWVENRQGGNKIRWFVRDKNLPDGGETYTALKSIRILAQTEDFDDETWIPYESVAEEDRIAEVTTDEAGIFCINGLQFGRVRVQYTYVDYETGEDKELVFRIGYGGDFYRVFYEPEDGMDEMFPTATKAIRLNASREWFEDEDYKSKELTSEDDFEFRIKPGYDTRLIDASISGDMLTVVGKGAKEEDGRYANMETHIDVGLFVPRLDEEGHPIAENGETVYDEVAGTDVRVNLQDGFANLLPIDSIFGSEDEEEHFAVAETVEVSPEYYYYNIDQPDSPEAAVDVRFIWKVERIFRSDGSTVARTEANVPVEITDEGGQILSYDPATGLFADTEASRGSGAKFTIRRLQGTGVELRLFALDPDDYEGETPIYNESRIEEENCWSRWYRVEALENVPELTWTETNTPSTCEVAGSTERKATYQDGGETKEYASYGQELPLAEHTWPADGTVKEPATCTAAGVKEYRCTVCGELLKTESIAKLEHAYSDWTEWAPDPEDNSREYRTRTCSVGHETVTEYRTAAEKDLEELINNLPTEGEDENTVRVTSNGTFETLADALTQLENEDNQSVIDSHQETDPGLEEKAQSLDNLFNNLVLQDKVVDGYDETVYEIKVDGSAAVETAGAYTVTITGVAATVASVAAESIRRATEEDDDEAFRNHDDDDGVLTYHAEANLSKVDETEEKITLEVSLKIVDSDGLTVQEDIEPISPISITLEIGENMKGKAIVLVHNGEEVPYSWKDEGTILFALSSLSQIHLMDAAGKADVEALLRQIDPASDIDKKAEVEAAREALDKLDGDLRAIVDPGLIANLEKAEASIKNHEAAASVLEAINNLNPNAGTSDKAAVQAARNAYNALTADQKKLVSADAQKKLENAEASVKNHEAAEKVQSVMNQLNSNAEISDKAAVQAARNAYNALTADQKKLVSSAALSKLESAETSIKKKEDAKKQADAEAKKAEAAAKAKAAADAAAKKEAAKKAAEDAVAKAAAAADAAQKNPTEANLKAAQDAITAANNAIAAAKAAGVDTASMKSKVNTASSTVTKAQEAAKKAAEAKKEKITISQKPSLSKVKAKGKGKATVTWKKLKKKTKKQKALYKKIKKIQIQYSTDSTFKTNTKSLTVGKTKKKYVLKGLKKKTTYYVRIRYVAADSYSGWSKTKKIKIKK